jgi:hypothetical protein
MPGAGSKENAGTFPTNESRGWSRIGILGCAFEEVFDVGIAAS